MADPWTAGPAGTIQPQLYRKLEELERKLAELERRLRDGGL